MIPRRALSAVGAALLFFTDFTKPLAFGNVFVYYTTIYPHRYGALHFLHRTGK